MKREIQGRKNLRSLILITALQMFTSRGYFNTSVQDIHKAANVGIGTIYHYFKGKEAIAKALYDDLINTMGNSIEEIQSTHETTHDRSKAIIEYLFSLTESHPEMMQYILYAKHREFMPGEKPICSSKPFETLLQLVKEGINKGEICDLDPVVATASLFGGAIRLIHLYLDDALENPLSEYIEEIWQCAWEAVT